MRTLPALHCTLPSYGRFALEALSLSSPQSTPPADVDWSKLQQFCDRTQLTLPVGLRCADRLPVDVRERFNRNIADNAKRWDGNKQLYKQITAAFHAVGLDFLVLKGFAHCPLFIADPRFRVQYDLDLLFPRAALPEALEVLRSLGYEPIRGFERVPLDHLPAMVNRTGWTWKGDYFDVQMPLTIELHYRLWDRETEGFDVYGLESFWERREQRELDGLNFYSLDAVDMVGYATLHLIRHLLRGDVRPFHVYELACLLDRTATDDRFWRTWRTRHDESLLRVSLIAFALAQKWFRCTLPATVRESMALLSGEVHRWLLTYGFSPVSGLFRPNKDELWLHWNLVSSTRRRIAIIGRRLIPERMAGPVQPVHVPKEQLTWRIRWMARWRYLVLLARRAIHHLRTLPSTAVSAIQWFSGSSLRPS
jgi:hypothetical protein